MAVNCVDLDDVATWPSAVIAYADEWARALRGTTRFAGDLDVPLHEADDFRLLFRGHPLRAIHCTRLLAHERSWIRDRGLRVASPERVATVFAVPTRQARSQRKSRSRCSLDMRSHQGSPPLEIAKGRSASSRRSRCSTTARAEWSRCCARGGRGHLQTAVRSCAAAIDRRAGASCRRDRRCVGSPYYPSGATSWRS